MNIVEELKDGIVVNRKNPSAPCNDILSSVSNKTTEKFTVRRLL